LLLNLVAACSMTGLLEGQILQVFSILSSAAEARSVKLRRLFVSIIAR
jgi:NADH:ubiquinone oxidoreductase subunit K